MNNPTPTQADLDYAEIQDSHFNRFDDELIDKYFNEDGKKAIQAYVTAHSQASQKALLDRLESKWGAFLDLTLSDEPVKFVALSDIQAERTNLEKGE